MIEKEVGVIEGEAVAVAPITIEHGEFITDGIVPGESDDHVSIVRNNSQKEYQIKYNLTMDPLKPTDKMLATFVPYVNGALYPHGTWVLLGPRSVHELLIRLTLLPDCPLGNGVKFKCRVWTGEELIE